jgi:hypothetical protein
MAEGTMQYECWWEAVQILTQVKYAATKNLEYKDYVTWKETVLEKAGNQCVPENQSYSKREVQFYLKVLKHYYNEKKDPNTGVCELPKQGEEIYCDVSIDPRKQNPINLGSILDSWKQRANSNIAIIMVYHATT